ncbi:MAG: monovalent cation/H+ antiporter complex subunit F [Brevibacterium sp.]|uniref:monovalent cation/H+ antiporter complex subunit F n=1 Tax=Brevibacterium sp. TaxID=1701 RepID=UPI00264737A0|nr:monovalent cation/H+ antiporter complex subunit F [Brevibacterium sp.]MDN5807155.1 monovalent cation/H+ antiporter complex subunit F [Brevibacterium sp.]MDN5833578.1 monovalent cation/H+ antiporter complex subunit F [Brevibacterium sp.]MDN5876864.1 monovalent cation/H+ antiporter complex subunit F [Brevibacterium sp.]MDN5909035.1 monovalent cation/H+ antiporter complex subunit F [Brevibacterium sp.]MDN6123456.1 monovalent cation/H+ antiporter complex subunit F [Brevibacterium sp.]
MRVVVSICILILAAAIIVGLMRVLTAKDLGSRAIVSDLMYFAALGILTMFGMLASSSIVLDAIFLASMVGILATIALARILTRGQR